MRKLGILMLSLAIAFTMTITSFAATAKSCGENCYYTLENGKLDVFGYGSIADDAFAKRKDIRQVIIHDGVTEVGYTAFIDCENIESLDIGKDVKAIRQCAFLNCPKLKNVQIPSSVTEIGFKAILMEQHSVPYDPSLPPELQMVGVWFAPVDEAVIICKKGSAALTYAKDNGIKYVVSKPVNYSIKLSKKTFKYDGKVHKPKVYVTLEGKGDIKYSVKYLTPKSKKVGTYKVKVTINNGEYVKTMKYTIKK